MTVSIYSLLSQNKLAETLWQLEPKVESLRDEKLQEQFHTLFIEYKAYLLVQTQASTFNQSEADTFYRKAYAINDKANRKIRILKSPNDQYSQAWKEVETNEGTSEDVREMFRRIWTSDLWDDEEKEHVAGLCESNTALTPVIVVAVTLALLEMFDEEKLMYLFDIFTYEGQMAKLRALIGIILVLRRYDTRIIHYPQVTSRLSLLAEEREFVRLFFKANMVLQQSKMTDSVSDKMRKDIFPVLMRGARKTSADLNAAEIDKALTSNGENPDWLRNMVSDKMVDKKIRQMAKMQMEGADIYMATFWQMKSYPFFSKLENWFMPFSYTNPELKDTDSSSLIYKMLNIMPLCDSDKYSFIFMVRQMGPTGDKLLQTQIEEQIPEDMTIDELMHEEKSRLDSKGNESRSEKMMRSYAQDLYRFFNIYAYRSQFFNPFEKKLSNFTPLERESFRCLLDNEEEMLDLAEFFMRQGLYQDALNLFLHVLQTNAKLNIDADLMQKLGFCRQKLGDYSKALDDLLKADSLKSGSHWTVLHISQVAFEDKQYSVASKYLDMLIEEEPEEMKHLKKKAECLFALDSYEEALPLLYKVVYLDDSDLLAHQMLAWALTMQKMLKKAEKEYGKCRELGDWSADIYLGHLSSIQGETNEALSHYRRALAEKTRTAESRQAGQEQFIKEFWSQVGYLKRIGLNKQTLQLLLDLVLLG